MMRTEDKRKRELVHLDTSMWRGGGGEENCKRVRVWPHIVAVESQLLRSGCCRDGEEEASTKHSTDRLRSSTVGEQLSKTDRAMYVDGFS